MYNHCLKEINITTLSVSSFAGSCEHAGETDGHRILEAQLSCPFNLEYDDDLKKLYILDHLIPPETGKIKVIKQNSDTVETYIAGILLSRTSSMLNLDTQLVLTGLNKIHALDLRTHTITTMAGDEIFGDQLGTFNATRFKSPYRVVSLPTVDDKILLVADFGNSR